MTLHSQNEFSIPEEPAHVARAAYPKGNLYLNMGDALGTIYQDESFAHLFPLNLCAGESTRDQSTYVRRRGHALCTQ